MRIKRAFLTLGSRQVHYRYGGSGPTVIMLHQSPKSSEELVPLMELLVEHFTVLAPDTPGYGLSDPLTPPEYEPEIDVFADAVAEFMDGLGLTQAGFYGLHTGAAIATRFAMRYPARVSALVANGTLIMTAAERSDFLAHYLPRFAPSWDGAHLAWAWARMREQSIFFPWYKREPGARMTHGLSTGNVQENVMPFLLAGDDYRTAYRGALAYEKEQDICRLGVPARFVCAKNDVLYSYLERFPPLPDDVAIERVEDAAAAARFTLDFFRERVRTVAPLKTEQPAPRRIGSSLIDSKTGQIHVRSNVNASGRPVLVLHDGGSSARAIQSLLGGLSGRRPVFAPDLPGHGDSDPLPVQDGSILHYYSQALDALLTALNLDSVDVVAVGAGASVALTLADHFPGRIANLTLCDPFIAPAGRADEFARNYVPSLEAEGSGAHLLRAWQASRDRDLFWPWFDNSTAAALPSGLPASNQKVQQRVVDLFKAKNIHAAFMAEIAHDPVILRLENAKAPVHLFATANAPSRNALAGSGPIHTLPENEIGWASIILEALG